MLRIQIVAAAPVVCRWLLCDSTPLLAVVARHPAAAGCRQLTDELRRLGSFAGRARSSCFDEPLGLTAGSTWSSALQAMHDLSTAGYPLPDLSTLVSTFGRSALLSLRHPLLVAFTPTENPLGPTILPHPTLTHATTTLCTVNCLAMLPHPHVPTPTLLFGHKRNFSSTTSVIIPL